MTNFSTADDQPRLRVGFCGTGEYSVKCAEGLFTDLTGKDETKSLFEVKWVVTPSPKPVGRRQTLTPSPLDQWAAAQNITAYHVEDKLSALRERLAAAPEIDFLVVVSFGYLIPSWLLELPKIAPINVHPSALPLYRGSSPGQFVILYGETESAVSIMKMNTKFDQGSVISQLPLAVSPLETQASYYDRAFELAQLKLPQVLREYAEGRLEQAQAAPPPDSPLARRLTRDDGYVSWELVEQARGGVSSSPLLTKPRYLGPVLAELVARQPDLTPADLLDRAVRALTPWPGVWTTVPEYKGKKSVRLKIHSGKINHNQYTLHLVQYEGENPRELGEK